ncbi:MAG: DUF523 domain-containing protein [Anaerovoracaceae bacterium]
MKAERENGTGKGEHSMKIMVSACLLGENCKYNGGNNRSEAVLRYVEGHQVIPVCPEVLGGLPVPRIPCEIVDGVVTDRSGISRDAEFRKGAAIALALAEEEQIHEAVLQSRSPSCGVKTVYDGTFTGTLKEGQGIFARQLLERGFRVTDSDDLKEMEEYTE